MKASHKYNPYEKVEAAPKADGQQGPLRRTYFRLRQIKQAGIQVKGTTNSLPKRSNDLYSYQQATEAQQVKAAVQPVRAKEIREKKLSNTASNFYSNMSRMSRMSSINSSRREPASMRKTVYSQRNQSSPPKPQVPGSLLFGRTSLSFHKQDIWKNENDNNYLNKYKIIKELGKGSFSTVFLARKQTGAIRSSRVCVSPLQLNPEISEGSSRTELDSSQSPLKLKDSQSLDSRSMVQLQKTEQTLPCLNSQVEESQQSLVAIKVYEKFKMNKDPHKFKNIRKQINIMQNLDSSGVIKLYESVETLTKISLVVEYGGEESLLEYVKHHYPLPMETVRDFSLQLIQGIAYLHDKNIVHRDIKLQNVLVHKGKIKLIDFGFSCLTHKQQKMSVICGTPNYMAPEVISRKEYIGYQADIWSFGVVVYALAEGRHPFKADSYNELERTVNRGKFEFKKAKEPTFMDFVRRVLRLKGADRPTAHAIMEMRWLKETPITEGISQN